MLTLTSGETVKVKITGDGTNIAKHIHVVNIAFTVLNEGSLALSPAGNRSIAVIQMPEDCDSLSSSLSEKNKEASELQHVNVASNRVFLGWGHEILGHCLWHPICECNILLCMV
jgi:hypothetical protein